jgi:hypothetical protein
VVRNLTLLLAVLLSIACNRGMDTKEAVRQGVIDYLSSRRNLNVSEMNVDVSSVSFRRDEADAMVSFTPKGANAGGQGMSIRYTLERKGSRWVVKNRPEGGGNPHGGAEMGNPKK